MQYKTEVAERLQPIKPPNAFTVEPPATDRFARWRMQKMLVFMKTPALPILDIGTPSEAKHILMQRFDASNVDSTLDCDFDYRVLAPKNNYGSITCFEVIEHLMNPLAFMENLRTFECQVYLSTPVRKLHLESMHVAEYTKNVLDAIFEKAGFAAAEYKKVHCMPLWWHLTGFRPFYRMFFHHHHFYRLMPK